MTASGNWQPFESQPGSIRFERIHDGIQDLRSFIHAVIQIFNSWRIGLKSTMSLCLIAVVSDLIAQSFEINHGNHLLSAVMIPRAEEERRPTMTLKDLRDVTKCHIFVGYTDGDGAEHFTEYKGKAPDRQISSVRIKNIKPYGFVLAAELEEEGV